MNNRRRICQLFSVLATSAALLAGAAPANAKSTQVVTHTEQVGDKLCKITIQVVTTTTESTIFGGKVTTTVFYLPISLSGDCPAS